jgi:hypothetical protein
MPIINVILFHKPAARMRLIHNSSGDANQLQALFGKINERMIMKCIKKEPARKLSSLSALPVPFGYLFKLHHARARDKFCAPNLKVVCVCVLIFLLFVYLISHLDRSKNYEIFCTCPDRPWGPSSLLYNGYGVFPKGKERPGRDAHPSPPSSAVVL